MILKVAKAHPTSDPTIVRIRSVMVEIAKGLTICGIWGMVIVWLA